MTETRILVGHERFNVGTEYDWLAGRDEDGAVVTFTGKVRNHNLGDSVKALTLEHYPGMTEKSLAAIVEEARGRWPLGRVTVIHRIGEMWPGEEIVFVGVTSAHRGSAFAAGEFIMDYLKTKAPFWKREATPEGERWVESRSYAACVCEQRRQLFCSGESTVGDCHRTIQRKKRKQYAARRATRADQQDPKAWFNKRQSLQIAE